MTREEALEVLRFEWYQHEDGSLVEQAIEKAFEALTWISVEERLPEDDTQVLACTKHGKAFSAHCENGRWRVSGSVKITHWMPLPEPPKEDTCSKD